MENTNNDYTYFCEFDKQFAEWRDFAEIRLFEDLRKGDFIDFELYDEFIYTDKMKQDFGTLIFEIVKRTFRIITYDNGISSGVYILKLKPTFD